MSHFIDAAELHELLNTGAVRVIDCRYDLFDDAVGRTEYAAGHIPGAVFFDAHRELADLSKTGEGRHPLPDTHGLAILLGERGFSDDTDIVVYDQTGSLFAARAWWLLRFLGHERVRVLSGGFAAWEARYDSATEVLVYEPATFTVRPPLVATVSREDVLANIATPQFTLFDARAPERYRGDTEPLDQRAGHIPGAENLPYETLRDEHGGLRQPIELPAATGPIAVYCGSGVSAAYLVLAFAEAGIDDVRLYPGSWSDWSSRLELPIATGD